MHNMHKTQMPVSAPSPASGDPSFNSGGPGGPQFNPSNARPGGNPAAGGQPQNRMPPPPSPAPGKDGSSKDKPIDGSPRNQQTPNPNNPSTPAPNQQNPPSNQGTPVGGARTAPSPVPGVMGSLNSMGPGPGGMNPPPGMGMMGMNPPPNMNQPPPTATSMSAGAGPGGNNAGSGGAPGGGGAGGGPGSGGMGIGSGMHFLGMNPMVGMNAGTGLMNLGGMNPSGAGAGGGAGAGANNAMGDLNMFSQEFMQGVANALDDIDPNLFRPDGDLNFERDFGQWFNHPDDSLDLK